jgi:formylmethanofuran dehydrogenase subunit E
VRLEVVQTVLNAGDDELFDVKLLPDFQYTKIPGSFNKAKCEICGEYVFERYLRRKDGKLICISCSGYAG